MKDWKVLKQLPPNPTRWQLGIWSMQRTMEYEIRIQELEKKLKKAEDAISQLKDKLQEHEKI